MFFTSCSSYQGVLGDTVKWWRVPWKCFKTILLLYNTFLLLWFWFPNDTDDRDYFYFGFHCHFVSPFYFVGMHTIYMKNYKEAQAAEGTVSSGFSCRNLRMSNPSKLLPAPFHHSIRISLPDGLVTNSRSGIWFEFSQQHCIIPLCSFPNWSIMVIVKSNGDLFTVGLESC